MKIAVDLGHGVGQDRGAVGIITEESVINSVGTLVIQGLINSGHQVLEVRPSGQGMSVLQSLSYRTTSSNNFGAELYVSIHANAGGGVGTEIFTYKSLLQNINPQYKYINKRIFIHKKNAPSFILRYNKFGYKIPKERGAFYDNTIRFYSVILISLGFSLGITFPEGFKRNKEKKKR